jgi:sulfur transfer complex TusBCD TusB component (DsrH family)
MNKEGQVVIFVIVAVMIVAAIALLFVVFRGPGISIGQEFDPETFIDKCLMESVREKVEIMLPQGGFVNPTDFKLYNDTKVAYLCKTVNFYEPCIIQHPLYISVVKNELKEQMREDVEGCFILLEEELDSRGYFHEGGDVEIIPVLKPDVVEVKILRDFTFSKGDIVRDFDSFDVRLRIPLYDLAHVANTIAANEARFCYFEYVGYTNLYPRYDIEKWTTSDSTRIYTIVDKPSGAVMNIATRGCAIPAGF